MVVKSLGPALPWDIVAVVLLWIPLSWRKGFELCLGLWRPQDPLQCVLGVVGSV